MKYFVPELLARCRSLNDDVAETAAPEWEQAIAAYNARLKRIQQQLPLGARQLLKHVTLHDAQVLTINRAKGELFLTFRLAKGAQESAGGVELRYSLARQPELAIDEPQAAPNGPLPRWVLYDEFELVQRKGVTIFTHSVLMSGGLEFRISFFNLRLKWFGKVLLANSRPSEIEKELADDEQLATA